MDKLIEEHKAQITILEETLDNETKKRKKLLNKVIELQGNIRVFCRVRPLNSRELEQGDVPTVSCTSDETMKLMNPENQVWGQKGLLDYENH